MMNRLEELKAKLVAREGKGEYKVNVAEIRAEIERFENANRPD
jgi:hypothetical protein